MKLKESIPSTTMKIIDLYNKIESELLDTTPDFQRKLVWKKQHKYQFIETILMNFPFPEIYIASSEIDIDSLIAKEIVVDGQQRLNAIVDYIKGVSDFRDQKRVKPFDDLEVEEKKAFLNYAVTVKDLKDMELDIIKQVFERINLTEYSLNATEKKNAQYGYAEFVIFCKQVISADYTVTENDTDIVLDVQTKKELNDFFSENNIFSENDKSRMFDLQFMMLIVSTLLEGDYYSRFTKISQYLENYNSSFENYSEPLDRILSSIRLINRMGLSKISYWFNKANVFSLIIELSKVDTSTIDIIKLEVALLELERKVEAYFSENTIEVEITDNEKKYFEVARQGGNEKSSRDHRGKVIGELINGCLIGDASDTESQTDIRLKILKDKDIAFTVIKPTRTGLNKSIMDAITSVRNFLKLYEIHDYSAQKNGAEHKVRLAAKYILESTEQDFEISLYRSKSRGDYRIWFTDLKKIAEGGDILAIAYKSGNLYILNVTQLDLENLLDNVNPFTSNLIS